MEEHRIGPFTKRAGACYSNHILRASTGTVLAQSDDDDKIWSKYINAFTELGLQYTLNEAQICQMCQSIIRERTVSHLHRQLLSYSEFCLLACELLTIQHIINQSDIIVSNRYLKFLTKETSKVKSHQFLHEVFLGGSCNPTVWRREVSIPLLQENGITYYNPQVDKWTPELVDIEEQAKDNATVLLFVVDNQTRAISSMIEVAYLIGRDESVVIVINDFKQKKVTIADESLNQLEIDDLTKSRHVIKKMAAVHNVITESTVREGTESVVMLMKRMYSEKDLIDKFKQSKIANRSHVSISIKKLHGIFSMYDNIKSGRLSCNEVCLALCSLNVLSRPFPSSLSSLFPDCPLRWEEGGERGGVTFEDFCILYCELKYSSLSQKRKRRWTWSSIGECLWGPFEYLLSDYYHSVPDEHKYDLYLGGTEGLSWRGDTVIPLLIKYGISYYNPQSHRDSFIIEECARSDCNVLMFVITGNSIGTSPLIEAAYCIGEGSRPVVLCIEELQPDSICNGQLATRAIKDYNRARVYLTSLANKRRVPVHTDITQATIHSIHTVLQHSRTSTTTSLPTSSLLSSSPHSSTILAHHRL